jgi:signal transduction histidine kinase
MSFLRTHIRAILLATAFAAVIVALSALAFVWLESWSAKVVESNETFARIMAGQLRESSGPLLDSLAREGVFTRDNLTKREFDAVDARLKALSSKVLSGANGFEGGFYLTVADEFVGYAYPSSPPPAPVYGPPPRSYKMIKEQLLASIRENRDSVGLHQFDPAIFPLATQPIMAEGRVVGAAWARVHIERELPALKLREVINVASGIALLGFVAAVWISMTQARRISRLQADMENIRSGISRRVSDPGGKIGSVSSSINSMLETLDAQYQRGEQLERELHQREKMSALGHLVAGVVHEVKTPLAIIKTRVQMWQQALAGRGADAGVGGVPDAISPESLQLVVHEINRLAQLVNRLLVFSRPMAENLRPTDIAPLILTTIKLVETHNRDISIEYNPDDSKPLPPVPADRNALEQVFLNVLMNSVESIKEAGHITIGTSYDAAENQVTISIRDDGPGVPADIRSSLFDPFVTTKEKGFGLGLSVAYEIVTAHGGSIGFEDVNLPGAHCVIKLPVGGKLWARRSHGG